MRYEQLGYSQKMQMLKNLHTLLNQSFFDGKLNSVHLDVVSLNDNSNMIYEGVFRVDAVLGECIEFSYEFEELLRIKENQLYFLTIIMLHEMIHQYCYENSIDDAGHNVKWLEVAKQHGLIRDQFDSEILSDNVVELLKAKENEVITWQS